MLTSVCEKERTFFMSFKIHNRYPINALHYSRFIFYFSHLHILLLKVKGGGGEREREGRRQINNEQIKNLQPQLHFFPSLTHY